MPLFVAVHWTWLLWLFLDELGDGRTEEAYDFSLDRGTFVVRQVGT